VRLRLRLCLCLCICVAFASAACGSPTSPSTAPLAPVQDTSGNGASGQIAEVGHFGVGTITETFVDTTRTTPATAASPAHRGRVLVTTIYYPTASEPRGHNAMAETETETEPEPDRAVAPYPLIVFAHGLGSTPSTYSVLLEDWASAGYVVAAPTFPLTSSSAPGGPDLSDYVNQPADMSFVISSVLRMSSSSNGPLAGLVDPQRIGAAGHSLGGVTMLGLVADSCCHDRRVDAAVVMSGDAIGFPTGRPDYSYGVPMLLVHGNADQSVPYVSSVDVFNRAVAPKGLLTIEGGGHDSPVDPSGRAFSRVVKTTTDFFDVYLKKQKQALSAMKTEGRSAHTRLVFLANRSRHLTLPTPTTIASSLQATVNPDRGLTDGKTVTVSWKGYAPGTSVNVLECSKNPPTGPSECDLTDAKLLQPDPEGHGSLSFSVKTGSIGTGTCDAQHPGCVIVVNEGGSISPSSSKILPISFGA
jgi:alpha-beta hydrolase superfamily lysophospholipase